MRTLDILIRHLQDMGIAVHTDAREAETLLQTYNGLRQQKAWHGSGVDFDRLSLAHVGEGTQANLYGWGIYLTQSRETARNYAESMNADMTTLHYIVRSHINSDKPFSEKKAAAIAAIGRQIARHEQSLEQAKAKVRFVSGDQESRKQAVMDMKHAMDAIRSAKEVLCAVTEATDREQVLRAVQGRHLYEVEIPDVSGGNYLHWEQPLTYSQSHHLLSVLEESGVPASTTVDWDRAFQSGAATYKALVRTFMAHSDNPQKEASLILDKAGFDGIAYTGNEQKERCLNLVMFNEQKMTVTDHIRFFLAPDGEAYGFVHKGGIWIDRDRALDETPLHEFAHLWSERLRATNQKEWQRIVQTMKTSLQPLWQDIARRYPNLKGDDDIADEVLAHYSGRRNGILLQRQLAATGGDLRPIISAVNATTARFWRAATGSPKEDIADRIMSDFLRSRNPLRQKPTATRSTRLHPPRSHTL